MELKSSIIFIGLIVILVGGTLLLLHNAPRENEISDFVREEYSWTISRSDFVKGENISVGFIPGYNWAWPPHDVTTIDDIYFPRIKIFSVRITDQTSKNYTEFDIILVIPAPPYDPGQIRAHPRIEVNHHGGIVVEDLPGEIGGTVINDGNYTVETYLYPGFVQNVVQDGNETHSKFEDPEPPPELRLYRISTEIVRPYTFLLSSGLGITIVGIAILAFSVLKPDTTKPHRKAQKKAKTRAESTH